MPTPDQATAPPSVFKKFRRPLLDTTAEPKTDELLRQLIDEVRGLRRDLQARDWRRGERLVGKDDLSD